MKASNIWNLEVNDIIRLTYNTGEINDMIVERVTANSWYKKNGGRNSFGTLQSYFDNAGDVVKCEIIKP